MTDKEKINNLICCILFASAEYENQIIMYKNSFEKHKSTDPYLILDLYKAQCKYEAYKELSVKIEKKFRWQLENVDLRLIYEWNPAEDNE